MGRRRYALEQKEVMVDAGEDLAGWENVVLDGVSLLGARGCVEVWYWDWILGENVSLLHIAAHVGG